MIAILDCHLQAAQPATANLLGHAARPWWHHWIRTN